MRGGPKVGGDAKKGGGIKGMMGNLLNVSFMIPGAGEDKSHDAVITRKTGANK